MILQALETNVTREWGKATIPVKEIDLCTDITITPIRDMRERTRTHIYSRLGERNTLIYKD